jgi:HEAT repeat protein
MRGTHEYTEQREREMNATGPAWEDQLAAAPGNDDIDKAISLLHVKDDYDYRAVDFLANELSARRDSRVINALVEVVSYASFPARDRAATALAKADATEARGAILDRLKEPNFAGPLVAALGRLGDDSTVRQLSDLATNTDDMRVRRNANEAKHLIAVRRASDSQ